MNVKEYEIRKAYNFSVLCLSTSLASSDSRAYTAHHSYRSYDVTEACQAAGQEPIQIGG